uniref:Uncharacterized protein n=1 Tax=Glossina pallidipes TaxID=7398 RepID=A0A1B0AFI5_GLOPL
MPLQPIRFFYDLLNQSSRALYIFLESSKIPFEAVSISVLKGVRLKQLIDTSLPLSWYVFVRAPVMSLIFNKLVVLTAKLYHTINMKGERHPCGSLTPLCSQYYSLCFCDIFVFIIKSSIDLLFEQLYL